MAGRATFLTPSRISSHLISRARRSPSRVEEKSFRFPCLAIQRHSGKHNDETFPTWRQTADQCSGIRKRLRCRSVLTIYAYPTTEIASRMMDTISPQLRLACLPQRVPRTKAVT